MSGCMPWRKRPELSGHIQSSVCFQGSLSVLWVSCTQKSRPSVRGGSIFFIHLANITEHHSEQGAGQSAQYGTLCRAYNRDVSQPLPSGAYSLLLTYTSTFSSAFFIPKLLTKEEGREGKHTFLSLLSQRWFQQQAWVSVHPEQTFQGQSDRGSEALYWIMHHVF